LSRPAGFLEDFAIRKFSLRVVHAVETQHITAEGFISGVMQVNDEALAGFAISVEFQQALGGDL
jgi:hypothetical protein